MEEQLRPIDRVKMELGEICPFLDIVAPYLEELNLNRRYRWFMERMAGINIACSLAYRRDQYSLPTGDSVEDFLQSLERAGGGIALYESKEHEGRLRVKVEWTLADYFLQDGEYESTGVSLFDYIGFGLFENGLVKRTPKLGNVSPQLALLDTISSGSTGINTHKLLNRLDNGRATCLEATMLAAAAISLFQFYKESVQDMRIIGLGDKNFFLGDETDDQHFGLVIKDMAGQYGVMFAGARYLAQTFIDEKIRTVINAKRGGGKVPQMDRAVYDQYRASHMMIMKGKGKMR